MPEDCAFHIDDVCIPCSWYLVRKDFNDSLVIATKDPDVLAPNDVELYYQIILPPGSYDGDSLASAIKTKCQTKISQTQIIMLILAHMNLM